MTPNIDGIGLFTSDVGRTVTFTVLSAVCPP